MSNSGGSLKNLKPSVVNPKSEVAIRRSMQKVNQLGRIMTRLIRRVREVNTNT